MTPAWVVRLREAVASAPHERLTDDDLRRLDIPPTRARRYFKEHYGMTFQELASCEETVEDREQRYREALMWFETCIDAPALGPDTLRIIARGYFHIGQMCLKAHRTVGPQGKLSMHVRAMPDGSDAICFVVRGVHGAGAVFSGPGQLLQLSELKTDQERAAQIEQTLADWRARERPSKPEPN